MSKRSLLAYLFLVLPGATIPALAQVNDAGLWTSITLEKKFSKKISASLSEVCRFNENISEAGTLFSELEGQYQVTKRIVLSAGYRFIQKRRVDDSYSKRHRVFVDLSGKQKLRQFTATLRIRYQSQYADVQSDAEGKIPKNYLRTKVSLKYNLTKRVDPFLSAEMFFHLNRPEGVLFDNYRLAGGFEYRFSKKSSLDIGYLIDREIQVINPWTNYVINLGWTYKL